MKENAHKLMYSGFLILLGIVLGSVGVLALLMVLYTIYMII